MLKGKDSCKGSREIIFNIKPKAVKLTELKAGNKTYYSRWSEAMNKKTK